jgi:hypothetical protein
MIVWSQKIQGEVEVAFPADLRSQWKGDEMPYIHVSRCPDANSVGLSLDLGANWSAFVLSLICSNRSGR